MKNFYIFVLLVVFTSLFTSCSADDSNDLMPHANQLDNAAVGNDTIKDKNWDKIKIK